MFNPLNELFVFADENEVAKHAFARFDNTVLGKAFRCFDIERFLVYQIFSEKAAIDDGGWNKCQLFKGELFVCRVNHIILSRYFCFFENTRALYCVCQKYRFCIDITTKPMHRIKETFLDFFKNEETKKEMKTMIRPIFDLIYNEMYVYFLLICIYNIVLVFILLVILYILVCIWYKEIRQIHNLV